MSCEHCTRVALTEADLADLRRRRGAARLPRKVIAWEVGVTMTTIQRWEDGKTHPTIDQYKRWIRALAAPD